MSNRSFGVVIGVVVIALVALMSVYKVDEREVAVVVRFGEIVKADPMAGDPGLRFKRPLIDTVLKYDARIQTMDSEPQQFLTTEKKNLIVDAFVKWRISDVYLYHTKLQGSKASAENRLAQRVNDSLRQEFGKRTVNNVVSGDRDEIIEIVRNGVNEEMESLGIDVVDVRLKRVDLDDEISNAVYARMEAERSRVAKELRAEGAELAEQIRADADRRRAVLLAQARRKSDEIRGAGDARATRIYAEAYGKDDEFFRFYRSLAAYRETFTGPGDLLVVDPSSEFFRFFKDSDADGDVGRIADNLRTKSATKVTDVVEREFAGDTIDG